jgi:hypothetical protein
MQFTCIPGNDGGIKQSFFVEVINSDGISSPDFNTTFGYLAGVRRQRESIQRLVRASDIPAQEASKRYDSGS